MFICYSADFYYSGRLNFAIENVKQTHVIYILLYIFFIIIFFFTIYQLISFLLCNLY